MDLPTDRVSRPWLTLDKARMSPVTAPAEIASIERNELSDIIGGRDKHGNYWAYTHSLERWRAGLRTAPRTTGSQDVQP